MEHSEDEDISDVDVIGFAKEVIALLKQERKTLMEKGLDVDRMIEELEDILQQALDSKARLDDIKRQMIMSMSKSLVGGEDTTHHVDERLDMAAETLRKDEDVQEYFRRVMRRKVDAEDDSRNS